MSLGKGFEGILGVVKEPAYGTVAAVTKAIPFVSENFGNDLEKHMDEVLRGKAGQGPSVAGNKMFPFTIPCKLTYSDLDLLIAIALGAAAAPSANGDLYDGMYSPAENLSYSYTAAVYKGVSVWEYSGNKIDTLKISGEANKPLDIEVSGAAKSLSLASATNTSVIMLALDTDDVASKIMFSDLEFKIAAQASALSGVTEAGISQFDLTVGNKLKLDDFDNRALTILEPQRNGFREVKFNFTVPRYEADTYLGWRDNDTALHASLTFTSGSYSFAIHLPKIKIDKADAAIGGPSLIQQKIQCSCYRDPGSVSASFTLTDEIEIAVTNDTAASPLV